MKKYATIVILSLIFPGVSAQFSRQVIQLKNKAFSIYSLANPSQYLSPRAIQRRTRYGISIDSTDLPITQRYLDSLSSVPDVQVLSVSRWLNQVLIKTTSAVALAKINSFPFVQSAAPIAPAPPGQPSVASKFNEVITGTDPEPNRPQQLDGDTLNYGNSYAQIHIHEGEFLHNKKFTGQGMVIAVLDGGFQSYKTITAFDSVRLQGRILGERDFVAFDNSVNEDHPHGMQCLSIICANWPGRMVGSAPGASFWLVRTEDVASEYPVEEFNYVVGAEFADSVGADMISCSLGYNLFDDPQFNHTYAQLNGNTIFATVGADLAAKKGILLTNSAGNEGSNSWQYITVPSDADSIVCVGAVNSSGAIAGFSSRGIPSDPRIKPSVVSVGVGTVIAGANNQPSFGNGTSYSNPNLNGLIACLWQAFPEFNNKKIMDAVYQSSDRYANPDKTYGYGIPNFKIAYYILKKQRNDVNFGTEWLKANPNPFNDTIRVDFVGQKDGTAIIELLQPNGTIIAQKTIAITEQDILTTQFLSLANLPPGTYKVRYSDGTGTRMVTLQKLSGLDFAQDWMLVFPVPYRTQFTVAIKSPVSGTATIRILKGSGQLVESYSRQAALNEIYSYQFKTPRILASGIYYVEYNDGLNRRVKRVIRQ
ncbi:MAG: S8 family serine peptidase [Chitinophagaceae bacterium]